MDENVVFQSVEPGWNSGQKSSQDPTTKIVNDPYDSHNFLQRPVLIYTREWIPMENFYDIIDPWTAVCEDSRVKSRLENFMNMRSDLEIRIVLNGGPFYSGRLIASYLPFGGQDSVYLDTGVNDLSLINLHQMQHIMCDPNPSEGGELLVPFLHPNHSLRIPDNGWNQLGRLIVTPFNELRHSNDGTVPVSISIFAMLKSPKLNGTTQAVPQSSEYGIISGPANIIGKVAGALKDVPGIGMYAKATEMVAKVGVSVAKMFGYSRPRELVNPYHTDLACTDTPFNGGALSFTAKKECLISPTLMGASDEDQLSLAYHSRKWNYLTQFEWSTTDGPGTMLFNMGVNPLQGAMAGNVLQLTNQGWIANLFQSWHGSVEIMVQPVVSAHHRGRLVVIHDPIMISDTAAQFEQFNIANRAVLDLTCKESTVYKLGWLQDGNYLPVVSRSAQEWSEVVPAYSASSFPPRASDNGQFGIFVLNQLTAPSEFVQITRVNIYFRLCEDFSFQDPTQERINGLSINGDPLGPDTPGGSLITPEESLTLGPIPANVTTFTSNVIPAELGLWNSFNFRQGVGVNNNIRGILIDGNVVYDGMFEPEAAGFFMPFFYEGTSVSLTVQGTGAGDSDYFLRHSFSDFPTSTTSGVRVDEFTTTGIGGEGTVTFLPTTPFFRIASNATSRPILRSVTYSFPVGTELVTITANNTQGLDVEIDSGKVRLNQVIGNHIPNTSVIGLGASMDPEDTSVESRSTLYSDVPRDLFFDSFTYLRNTAVPQAASHEDVIPSDDAPEPKTPDVELQQGWVPDDSDIFYGEKILSLRTLLKRFTTSYFAVFTGSRAKQLDLPHYPRGIPGANMNRRPMTLFNYLERGFLGVRGSMRVSVLPCASASEALYCHTRRLPSNFQNLPVFGNPSNEFNGVSDLDGAHFACVRSIGSYNVEFPYYDRVRFLPSRAGPAIIWPSLDGAMNHYRITFSSVGPVNMTVNYATGEDFNFLVFVTVSRYTVGALRS